MMPGKPWFLQRSPTSSRNGTFSATTAPRSFGVVVCRDWYIRRARRDGEAPAGELLRVLSQNGNTSVISSRESAAISASSQGTRLLKRHAEKSKIARALPRFPHSFSRITIFDSIMDSAIRRCVNASGRRPRYLAQSSSLRRVGHRGPCCSSHPWRTNSTGHPGTLRQRGYL